MNAQATLPLWDAPKPLKPSEQEVHEALRVLIVASDTTDIQRALAERGIPRERSNLAKRLCELEAKGLVARCGSRDGKTLWRRLP